jgi:hypothetical protein
MRWREFVTMFGGMATWPRIAALGLLLAEMSLVVPTNATTPVPASGHLIVLAQAMIPRTGMMDAQNPMPMKERYLKRFPQPARGRSHWHAGARSLLQDARLCSEGGTHSCRRDRVYRRLQPMVGLVRAASCGAA